MIGVLVAAAAAVLAAGIGWLAHHLSRVYDDAMRTIGR